VILLPVTQPQLTTRLMVMRSTEKMNRMAVSIGGFAIAILLPVVAIGMYGAVEYGEATTREFLSNVLLFEQSGFVAAAAIVGLLTAAMSTADSQLFALGTELRSLLSGDEHAVLRRTKVAIIVFGILALIFSVFSSDQLVLLARVSFNGTALLAPLVIAGVFSTQKPGAENIAAAAAALVLFLGSLVGVVPEEIGPFRLDLLLLMVVGAFTATTVLYRHYRVPVTSEPAP
jgi:SSS family solute:Na+ symporter